MLLAEKKLLEVVKQTALIEIYSKIKNGEQVELRINGIELAIDMHDRDCAISRLDGNTNISCIENEDYKVIVRD